MGYRTGAKEFPEADLAKEIGALGVELPGAVNFPFTLKLDEKFAAHFDRKGLELIDGRYTQTVTCVITQNQVVLREKGD